MMSLDKLSGLLWHLDRPDSHRPDEAGLLRRQELEHRVHGGVAAASRIAQIKVNLNLKKKVFCNQGILTEGEGWPPH